ncbi:MAG: uracil-DNA glycosylase [Acidobacteriota bacterium]|jgi:DNA polymerase|nr:uracil-DNA glycosylase [Acidobacteriota bacterium]
MNRKILGEQIHGHLQLYRDLGVRYVSRPAPSAQNRKPKTKNPESPPAETVIAAGETVVTAGETLEAILADIGNCRRCKLAPTRTNLVFGSGNPRASLMFVGEAPGADEDEQGLPFVGRAGRLLTLIVESIGFRREDVYICNILKCRPPNNRNPETDEIAACEGFLFRQIAAVQPGVIVALGTFGAQTLLKTTETIGKLRGRLLDYRGVKLIATYHPAYLLRSPLEKRKVWDDMRIAHNYIRALPRQ